MSDLGMKAVSRVAVTDREPFLKALVHIAAVDDSVDLNEKEMVEQYVEAWELGGQARSEIQEVLQNESSFTLNHLVSQFSESGTRFLLVQELMRLAYADGTYGEAERKEIASLAQRMGMSEDEFREVEKWMGRGQAWENTAADNGHGEDDLEEVLGREDEDEEHDLSDIETGDADLSEIDSSFSEVDPSEFEDEDLEEEIESDEEVDAEEEEQPDDG
jgi:uncharacterized tellurite resistance protein B-like protein